MTPEERFCDIAVTSGYLTEPQAGKLLEDWMAAAMDGPSEGTLIDLVRERGLMSPAQIAQTLSLRDLGKKKDIDKDLLRLAVTRGFMSDAQAEAVLRQHEAESRIHDKRLLNILLETHALTQAQAERLLAELSSGSPAAPPAAPAARSPVPARVPTPVRRTPPTPPRAMAAPMAMPQNRPPMPETRKKTPVGISLPTPPPPMRDARRSVQEVKWRMFLLEMRTLIGGVMVLAALGVVAYFLLQGTKAEERRASASNSAASGSSSTGVHSPPPPSSDPPRGGAAPPPASTQPAPWDSSPLLAEIASMQEAESKKQYSASARSVDTALGLEGVGSNATLATSLAREKDRLLHAQDRIDAAVFAEAGGQLQKAHPLYAAALDTLGTIDLARAAERFLKIPSSQAGPVSYRLLAQRYQALVLDGQTARSQAKLDYALVCFQMAQHIAEDVYAEPPFPDAAFVKETASDLARALAGKLDPRAPPLATGQADPQPPANPPQLPPAQQPPPAPPTSQGGSADQDLAFVPGIHDLKDQDLQEVRAATAVLLDLWRDRANPATSLEEKRRDVKEADARLGKLSKATGDKPAVLFVQGVTHFLLARGIFDEFMAKRTAAATVEEQKRLVVAYEPEYNRELSSAANKLTFCRKGARKSYAAAVFEDLSRAWDTGKATAGKGMADLKRDQENLRPESVFDTDLQGYVQQNGLPRFGSDPSVGGPR